MRLRLAGAAGREHQGDDVIGGHGGQAVDRVLRRAARQRPVADAAVLVAEDHGFGIGRAQRRDRRSTGARRQQRGHAAQRRRGQRGAEREAIVAEVHGMAAVRQTLGECRDTGREPAARDGLAVVPEQGLPGLSFGQRQQRQEFAHPLRRCPDGA
ncbi:MAG: hypothetical protein NVS9B10_21390 [Nevskia sp.]